MLSMIFNILNMVFIHKVNNFIKYVYRVCRLVNEELVCCLKNCCICYVEVDFKIFKYVGVFYIKIIVKILYFI